MKAIPEPIGSYSGSNLLQGKPYNINIFPKGLFCLVEKNTFLS